MSKLYIFAFFFSLLMQPGFGHAAKLFVQKDKPASEQESAPATAPLDKVQSESQDSAPDETNRDIVSFANRYFQNCKNADHPLLKGPDLEMFCACTSAQIPGNMSIAQITVQQENSPEGQKQRNRMLMHVYGPCIEHPTRAMVMNRCLNTKDVIQKVPDYKKVCTCLGDSMAEYMQENAPGAIQSSLAKNPNDLDPLGTLLASRDFDQQSQTYLQRCILTHALQ